MAHVLILADHRCWTTAAHETPWSATRLGRVASQCSDLPPGAFNVLTSSGDAVLGAMLTGDPRVDVVSFTGSTATGRRVMESAARTVKKTLLELGGTPATIVLDDAEFPQALKGAAVVCDQAMFDDLACAAARALRPLLRLLVRRPPPFLASA